MRTRSIGEMDTTALIIQLPLQSLLPARTSISPPSKGGRGRGRFKSDRSREGHSAAFSNRTTSYIAFHDGAPTRSQARRRRGRAV